MNRAPDTDLDLPPWSVVSPKRLAHIARVTALLDEWTDALALSRAERLAWRDAGRWHDALRDAAPSVLGPPDVDPTLPPGAWHGPAAAARLRDEGEDRDDVLSAITWHTVGDRDWDMTGRALYCADFLDPGRGFLVEERARLAARFPDEPDAVFREVVRHRVTRAEDRHVPVHPRTAQLWDQVR